MPSDTDVARALAAAFLSVNLEVDGVEELMNSGSRLLGKRWRWMRPLAQRVAESFSTRPRPRKTTVAKFILGDRSFRRACERHDLELEDPVAQPSKMRPFGAATSWRVPSICNLGELAKWLSVSIGELEWFADLRQLEQRRSNHRLRHYHYRPLTKRFGQIRLIESPKPRLKQLQRRILTEILEQAPLHSSVHGFRRGHSIKTFAAPHIGRKVVLKIDLRDFFPSITAPQVGALFRTVGYPEDVADLLTGLCTNSTPWEVWTHDVLPSANSSIRSVRWLYSQPHLPQGAPTSPALANLGAYRMDCRLSGLASSVGATYTRYADDLAFSGQRDFERVVQRFHLHAYAIVMEERFRVHHRKTRIMRQGVRQRLAGMVVNQHVNVSRDDYDRLKATLTNCIRHGPQSQNRNGHDDFRSHLQGRVSFVEMINPTRGGRLRTLFEKIKW